jgi:predicted transcriptional regulator
MLKNQHFRLANGTDSAHRSTMPRTAHEPSLSRRERQIMDVSWRLGRAAAAEIQAALPDPPSYSAVRALLAILVEKGHLTRQADGRRYVYAPRAKREAAGAGALRRLLATFFDDSASNLVAALLAEKDRVVDPEELGRIRALLDEHQVSTRR